MASKILRYLGALSLRVNKSTDLNRRIAGWIEGVLEYLK